MVISCPDYKLTIDKKGLFLLFRIDSKRPNGFNTRLLQCSAQRASKKRHAQIAQSVEQWIENPRVPGSIPGLGTILKPEVLANFGFFIAPCFLDCGGHSSNLITSAIVMLSTYLDFSP